CFLQAEDGIRDSSVTGVQTCALPISQLFKKAEIFLGPGELALMRREREPGGWLSRFLLAVFPAVVVPPNVKEHRGDETFVAGGESGRAAGRGRGGRRGGGGRGEWADS